MDVSEERQKEASETRPPTLHRVETTAETAECTCPDFCERDHDID